MADSFDHEDVRERPPVTEPAELPREHADPLAGVASLVGNRAFGNLLARDGAGLLPGGPVHPEVETAIAGTRGGGTQLDPGTRERLGAGLGDDLDDVRVHTGTVADGLARAVSARAFATGTRRLLRRRASTARAPRRATVCSPTRSPTSCSSAAPPRPAR